LMLARRLFPTAVLGMRSTIGCAAMIAAVAFVIGLIGALVANDANFGPLMMASMAATMAFVAALLLFSRDRARHRLAIRNVRELLLSRRDVSDTDFEAHFPHRDSSLVIQCRHAVSQFFDVPAEKIFPTDDLNTDLRFNVIKPGVHWYVVSFVLHARNIPPRRFSIRTSGLNSFDNLVQEIQGILDDKDH
jgi:hypothetical protein